MKNLITILLSLLLLASCSNKKTNKYESFYEILDELLRFNYHDAGVVVLDLNKTRQGPVVSLDYNGDTIKNITSPPPPPGSVYYSKNIFIDLYKGGFLDSIDISFMFSQIDTLRNVTLDSSRIIKKTISSFSLIQLFKQYGLDSTYQILRQKYDAYSYIEISTPLISKNGNKILLDVDEYCGGLCGGGRTYLFEKIKSKWRIIYSKGNWVS